MLKTTIRYGLLICLAVSSSVIMYGDMSDAGSSKNFDRILRKRPLVVALFYAHDRSMRNNKEMMHNVEALEQTFKRVSEQNRYKDAEIMFVRINTSKKDLALMAEHYGVRALPTYMIFRYGRPVRGARKEGFLRGYDLQLFIDEHLGSTINGYVQEKAAKKRRRNNRRSYTYVGYGVGGYPYGYYGYPYYGYGGGIGFGVGF